MTNNKNIGFKIFEEEKNLIDNRQCPICKKDMNGAVFTDELSVKEFKISGICQDCQNKIFG